MKLAVFFVCLTALSSVSLTDAKGSEVKDDAVFQEFRTQKPIRCSSNVGTGKQDSKLLNTQANIDEFKKKLTTDEATFFERLLTSEDYSVESFTGDQLLEPLKDVFNSMDSAKKSFFFAMKAQWSSPMFSVVTEFLGAVPPQNLLLLKKEVMSDLMGQLDEDTIKSLCSKLADDSVIASELATAFFDRSPDCIALAWKNRDTNDVRKMFSGSKGAYMYEKLQQTIPSAQWDVDALMLAPDVLTVELVNKVPDAQFCISAKRDRLSEADFYSIVPEDVLKAIAKKISKCTDMKDLSAWDNAKLGKFKIYLVNMAKSLMKSITIEQVVNNMDALLSLDEKKVEVIFRTLAPKFKTYWTTNVGSLTADQKTKILCIAVKYAPIKSFLKTTVDVASLKTFLKDAASKCPSLKFESRELSLVIKRVVSENGFTWDQQAIIDLGSGIAALPSSIIKTLTNTDVICDNWAHVKTAKFRMKDLKTLWTKCKTPNSYDLTSFTCAKIQEIGVFLQALSKTEIAEIPADKLVECAKDVAESLNEACKTNKGLCRAFWKQMKKDTSMDMVAVLKNFKSASEFAKMVDVSDMGSMDMDTLGGMDAAGNVDGTGKTASAVIKAMKKKYGDVSDSNMNYMGKDFKKMMPMFIMGGRNDDIRKLPEDASFVDALKEVDMSSLPQKKQKIVQDKLVKIFGLDTNTDVCLDPSVAERAAPFFAGASSKLLEKLQTDSLRGLLKGMGKDFSIMKKNTRAQMKLMTNVMSNIDNIGGKSEITVDDVAKYGPFMWCGVTKDTIGKFNWDALETFMEDIAQCAAVHMDRETKQAFVDRITSLATSNSVNMLEDPDRLVSMGSLIMQFLPTLKSSGGSLSSDNKEKLAAATRGIFEGLTFDREMKDKRNSKEVTSAENDKDHDEIKELASFFMDMIKSANTQKRRRRATDTLTCEDVKPFNGELSHLTADQIDSMDPADFVNCLPEFQKTVFAADVMTSLAAKLKAGINTDLTTWTTEDMIATGHLLDTLDDADIDKLALTDDVAAGIAQYVFAKKEKLIERYLAAASQTDTTAITADQLSSLGNLACGFTDTHVSSLTAQNVNDAASDLGNVLCFNESQITGLGSKIAEIKGDDWTSTDPEVVAQLGPLAGGLPQNVLEDFDEDMIGSMTKEAIAAVPNSVFAAVFTAEKLAYLSAEQANEVTDAQKENLSDLQKTALAEIATLFVDSTFKATGAVSTVSLCLMVITTAAWMVLQN